MENEETYGVVVYYANKPLNFTLPVVTETEALLFKKKKTDDGFRIEYADEVIITLFKINRHGIKETANIDISSVCKHGENVVLLAVSSSIPKLFVYTDETHFGWFPLP